MGHKTNSQDGTSLAYDVTGDGPAVVLVSGAMSTGATLAPLAESLAGHRFTVAVYDRRGRGASGGSEPYEVAREVEDLAALIEAVGGEAALCGVSSGGALALEAAAAGLPVRQVAVYETPFVMDEGGRAQWAEYTERLAEALGAGRRGEAVELFLRLTGLAEPMIEGARQSPMWAGMEVVAPSLAHDASVLGDGRVPQARIASVEVPVLAVAGGASPLWMREAAQSVARAAAHGTYRSLAGQTHMVDPQVLGPVLAEFFGG